MTTITELLTEVFNRVKSEHGVVLSRVDFSPASGTVGVAFRGVGCSRSVVYNGPLPPPNFPSPPPQVAYGGPLPPVPMSWPRPHPVPAPPIVHRVDPNDATHVGSVEVYDDCYWKFEDGRLYLWDGSGDWWYYDDGDSAQRTVESQLRCVAT